MSHLTRRQLLLGILGGLAKAAGAVVVARAVLSETAAQGSEETSSERSQGSVQERADQLAARQGPPDEEGHEPEFYVRAFGRGGFGRGGYGGGGFRRGGFANGGGYGGGGFRRGGFANGGGYGGGAFRNSGFRNW
jgi:rSAM-associated Gly-rich repeat protein